MQSDWQQLTPWKGRPGAVFGSGSGMSNLPQPFTEELMWYSPEEPSGPEITGTARCLLMAPRSGQEGNGSLGKWCRWQSHAIVSEWVWAVSLRLWSLRPVARTRSTPGSLCRGGGDPSKQGSETYLDKYLAGRLLPGKICFKPSFIKPEEARAAVTLLEITDFGTVKTLLSQNNK